MTRRTLDVYWGGYLTGKLIQDDGQLKFQYAESWLQHPETKPISQSLPLQAAIFKNKQCRPFFAGILPEADKRQRIAKYFGISTQNDFAMLEKMGGECAGALTIVKTGEPPPAIPTSADYYPLSDEKLAGVFEALPARPLMAGEEGMRLSLAGVQDKIAVALVDGKLCFPLHDAPSTHILKPAFHHFEAVAENEAFCMELSASIGLPAAKVQVRQLGKVHYLLVERYDRVHADNGLLIRLHQEDFCQALGIVPEYKYQNEGGPTPTQAFSLLRECSTLPVIDIRNLLDAMIFNYLIGNNDAHGKNFSLLYTGQGARFAPLYDLVSTAVYPELSPKMAMKVGSTYDSNKVTPGEWDTLAEACGLGAAMVRDRQKELADKVREKVSLVTPKHPIIKDIIDIIQRRAQSFK